YKGVLKFMPCSAVITRTHKINGVNVPRFSSAAAVIVAVTIALAGCGVLEPTPVVTPTATQAPIDMTTYIGEIVDPAGTQWVGRDSGGDDTTFTLHDDGTLAVK